MEINKNFHDSGSKALIFSLLQIRKRWKNQISRSAAEDTEAAAINKTGTVFLIQVKQLLHEEIFARYVVGEEPEMKVRMLVNQGKKEDDEDNVTISHDPLTPVLLIM